MLETWQRSFIIEKAQKKSDIKRATGSLRGGEGGASNFSFESAFVVNSTNPMVPCERSVVAVAHTHTPRRTARPPAAPPRRERDEEMGQRRRSHEHVWEGSVMRHAARRLSLSGTAPPFRGRRVTATPYALLLLPRRRPPIPPSSFPPRILRTPTSRPTLGLCPARPRPFCPSLTPRPDTHIQDKPGVLLSKEKEKRE